MRYAPGQKERTREKILEAAGMLFRRRGYDGAGLDEVMRQAGLTAGGFYSHFPSKEALLAEALSHASAQMEARRIGREKELDGVEPLAAFVDDYLSPSHRGNREGGCPLAALLTDVSRAGDPVKDRFEAILRELSAGLSGPDGEVPGEENDWVFALLALCVGGLGLARSVHDEALGDRILAACRTLAGGLLPQSNHPAGERDPSTDSHEEATPNSARGISVEGNEAVP